MCRGDDANVDLAGLGGADALELNMYEVVTDLGQSGAAIEHSLKQIVRDLASELKIPLAIKLSPFFTAFGSGYTWGAAVLTL